MPDHITLPRAVVQQALEALRGSHPSKGREMKLTDSMDRDTVQCYWLGKTQFVPHYTEEQVFVAPGGIERTEKWLLNRGAVKATAHLWPRHWLKKLLTGENL